MPDAAKSSSECGLHQLNIREDESVNLFKKQRIEGWWPLFKQVEAEKKELTVRWFPPLLLCDNFTLPSLYSTFFPSLFFSCTPQGKVEMELEILTLEEEQIRPAGKGREEPNMNPTLQQPKLAYQTHTPTHNSHTTTHTRLTHVYTCSYLLSATCALALPHSWIHPPTHPLIQSTHSPAHTITSPMHSHTCPLPDSCSYRLYSPR